MSLVLDENDGGLFVAPLVMAQLVHEDLEHVGEARVPEIVAKAFKGPKLTPWLWFGRVPIWAFCSLPK